jgi:PAS domain-containing protein
MDPATRARGGGVDDPAEAVMPAARRLRPGGSLALTAVRDEAGCVRDLRIQACSPGAARLVGVQAAELVGRGLADIAPRHVDDGVIAVLAAVVDSGEPWQGRLRLGLGRDAWWSAGAAPVGDVVVLLLAAPPAGEPERAADSAPEQRWRRATDAATEGLIVLSAAGNAGWIASDANARAERLLGRRRGEIAGRTLEEVVDAAAELGRRLERVTAAGRADHGRGVVRLPGLPAGVVEHRLVPIGPGEVLLSLRDVSAQARAESALRASAAYEATLRRLATELARAEDHGHMAEALGGAASRLVGAAGAWLARAERGAGGEVRIVGESWPGGERPDVPESAREDAARRALGAVVRGLDAPAPFGPDLAHPLVVDGRPWGAVGVSVAPPARLSPRDGARLAALAEIVQLALGARADGD